MSVANVARFIDELVLHFPRRETTEADEIAWARSMTRNLDGFSGEVLEKAAQIIIDTCDRRNFQWLPKQCKEACFEAQKRIDAQKPKLAFTGNNVSNDINDKERLAYELILGPLGRRAVREEWIGSLFTFTRDHMRLPTDAPCTAKRCKHDPMSQIDCCIASARAFDKALDDCRGAPPASLQSYLVPLGIAMLERRNVLTAYVETGVLP